MSVNAMKKWGGEWLSKMKRKQKALSIISFKFESYWELWWGTKYIPVD